jgi:hypothetical protein
MYAMKGSGFYNAFSHLQRKSVEQALPIIRDASKELTKSERFAKDTLIGVADYGCSQVIYHEI